jgi:tetratricopeptide (TPR) repeat protein
LEGGASEDQKILQLLSEGDRLYESEQYQKAIETWSEIFMLDVNHPTALQKIEQARAAANDQRNRMKDTLKNAQRAYEQGNTRQAYELFMQVKAIDPENSEANKYLSMMETPAAAPGAEPDLKELIALGESAQQNGNYRDAAQFFSKALAIDTDNAELADAIRNLNLLAKKNEQTKALLGNARAFKAEGKMDSAYHALNKAIDGSGSRKS